MVNRYRGEIGAVLDGERVALCLTLGALAELESAFGDQDLLALAERFERGRLSATDAVKIIGAGLRGAGRDITDDAVSRLRVDGGAAGYIDIVARLLVATFGASEVDPASDLTTSTIAANKTPRKEGQVRPEPRPFPGTK